MRMMQGAGGVMAVWRLSNSGLVVVGNRVGSWVGEGIKMSVIRLVDREDGVRRCVLSLHISRSLIAELRRPGSGCWENG